MYTGEEARGQLQGQQQQLLVSLYTKTDESRPPESVLVPFLHLLRGAARLVNEAVIYSNS